MPLSLIGIGVGMGFSFFLLYTRMKEWNTDKFRWISSGLLCSIGLIGLFGKNTGIEETALYWGMVVPVIYNGMDRLFKYLSQKYQNRDFYLYLRRSGQIKESPLDNPHIKPLDIVFSFGLVVIIALVTILSLIAMK